MTKALELVYEKSQINFGRNKQRIYQDKTFFFSLYFLLALFFFQVMCPGHLMLTEQTHISCFSRPFSKLDKKESAK